MRNKICHIIFIYGSWELIEGVFIFLPQVIVFLNHNKFHQLPTDSHGPKMLSPNQRKKKCDHFITFLALQHPEVSFTFHAVKMLPPLHVLNVRASLPVCCCLSDTSPACLHVSRDEDDKSLVAGKKLLKMDEITLSAEAVSPRAVLSLSQRCLHSLALVWNVSQSLSSATPHPHVPTTLDISLTLYCKEMLSSKWKCFVFH